MGKLSLEYIAGLIDADGSISISISKNRYVTKQGTSEPQFSFVVNLRMVTQYTHILEKVQQTLDAGRIYQHKAYSPTSTAMCSWQTTKQEDTIKVCKILLPHLKIKDREAALMLKALDIWYADNILSYLKKKKIVEIASEMNPSQQKETSRRNKEIRGSDFYPIKK